MNKTTNPVVEAENERKKYLEETFDKNIKKMGEGKGWAQYNAKEHFMFYEMIKRDFDVQLLYSNGEKVLFLPPSRDFVSILECVVNLKKQDVPELTGKLKLNVLFDRETEYEKLTSFKTFVDTTVCL